MRGYGLSLLLVPVTTVPMPMTPMPVTPIPVAPSHRLGGGILDVVLLRDSRFRLHCRIHPWQLTRHDYRHGLRLSCPHGNSTNSSKTDHEFKKVPSFNCFHDNVIFLQYFEIFFIDLSQPNSAVPLNLFCKLRSEETMQATIERSILQLLE
jgi:hypothetical protein